MTEETRSLFEVSCPDCLAGIRRLTYLTYMLPLKEDVVTVPNFPAWVCDLCGVRIYDGRAMSWLNALLSTPAHWGRASVEPQASPDGPVREILDAPPGALE